MYITFHLPTLPSTSGPSTDGVNWPTGQGTLRLQWRISSSVRVSGQRFRHQRSFEGACKNLPFDMTSTSFLVVGLNLGYIGVIYLI